MTENNARVALVTGASSGIGAATARLLGARGMRVVVNYLTTADAAKQVVADIQAAGGEAMSVQADVRDPASVQNLVDEVAKAWGGIDVLVHNALTPYVVKSFEDMTWEELGGKVNDEMRAGWTVTKAVLPAMTEKGQGRIILLSAGLAQRPRAGMIALGTAKAALVQFGRYLAQELGPRGITVNTVEPGPVEETRMAVKFLADDVRKPQVAATPMGRLATPADVARVVAFFAEEDSSYMTGTTSAVNGGMAMY